jgi:hypothetical protein
VLVARRPELLQPEVADVWVRLWDGVERVGGWSKPSWFDDVAAKIALQLRPLAVREAR